MKHILTATICGILALSAAAAPGLANPGKSRVQEKPKNDVIASAIIITPDERVRIHDYLIDRRRKDCPPGLAKKDNGCLPPGQARKYRVGETYKEDHPRDIWHELADLIAPPPSGYKFLRVDHDVLLVRDSDRRIVDIVRAE